MLAIYFESFTGDLLSVGEENERRSFFPMPLNKQVFRTRAISAIVFVIVMLAGLLWNHWSFLVLFTIIHFGCWHEYLNLIEKIYRVTFHRFLRWGMMLIGFGLMLSFCGKAYAINGFGIRQNLCLPLSLAGFLLLVLGIFQKNIFNLKAFGAAALGWLYISLSWGTMLGLRQEYAVIAERGQSLIFKGDLPLMSSFVYPIVLISSIWINDTMAYVVGSFIGKTPFSKISPKKTWEGTAGGAILCVLVITLVGHYGFHLPVLPLVVISSIAAIIGTAGDLFESKLKRMAGVKDSGTMMPGHGGFMDRFDSLLLATPFVWLVIKILAKIIMY